MVLNSRKIILLMLVVLLVIFSVSAVSLSAKKPVPLTVCLPSSSWGGSNDPGLMEDVKQYIEKKTDTSIKAISPPLNTYSDKINVLLASGDIPDIFRINKAMVNVHTFTVRGYTAALDKYVKKNKAFKNIDPKYFDYMRVNGIIRAIPKAQESEKVIWTRKDLLDQYGVKLSSTPTTEEFYNEMKKVNNRIPFTFPKFLDNLPFFYHSFGVYDEFIKDKKGKYYDVFNTDEMRECLNYVKRLYSDGILDKEFPTNDNSALRNNLISGKAAANIDYDIRYFYYMAEITRVDPNSKPDLKPIFKLIGPKGFGGALNEACQDADAISAKSKYPEAAVNLVAWMNYVPEGAKATRLGIPGKHYIIENGIGKLTPLAEAGGQTFELTNLMKMHVPVKRLNLGFKFPNEDNSKIYYNLLKDISKHTGRKEVISLGQSAIYDKVGPALVKKRQEVALKMIIGAVSIEDGFKEYDNFFKSINGAQLLKELNSKR